MNEKEMEAIKELDEHIKLLKYEIFNKKWELRIAKIRLKEKLKIIGVKNE